MKSLIICESTFQGNTRKVADAMAPVLTAKVVTLSEAKQEDLSTYDLIGFGSGINGFMHHQSLLKFADSLPSIAGKKAFVFSTSGGGKESYNDKLKGKLEKKGFNVIGSFACKGFDRMPYLGFIAKLVAPKGLNVGRPNETDLEEAKEFARGLM
jgi:flavodoxin